MDKAAVIISGNRHLDGRGSISFINDFDMSNVKRFYSIQPKKGVPRAWQGHKMESKWFHVLKGRFRVKLRALESQELLCEFDLEDKNPEILSISKGVFNGFESLEEGSRLLVFSDATFEQSQSDDYRADLRDIPW